MSKPTPTQDPIMLVAKFGRIEGDDDGNITLYDFSFVGGDAHSLLPTSSQALLAVAIYLIAHAQTVTAEHVMPMDPSNTKVN